MKRLAILVVLLLSACGGDTPTGPAPTPREIFRQSGTGDTVFDMPLAVARVRVVATYTQNSSNFIVRISGRSLLNELLGTGWNTTRYEGTLLTGGGGVVAITNSSGVQWSFEEVR